MYSPGVVKRNLGDTFAAAQQDMLNNFFGV
jgi:hypothetical protein